MSSETTGLKPAKKGRGKAKAPAKTVTSVALDDELIALLSERAVRDDRTVSSVIRLAIRHYFDCVK
ncbi:MAG: hypothetical protein BVN35_08095 [Proteobacteria bacterium ST_bin11]|nr:MAG: hypothetical protein BVN35_08095 [Proteobacteria bacterium ST_bin11]